MNEAWWLFVVVVALYLHDCVLWQAANSAVFLGRPGRCRVARQPMLTIGNNGGISFLDPLPPLATAFRIEGSEFKLASARSRLEKWRVTTWPLRVSCNLLFAVIFGGAFLLCWFSAWSAWWPVWVAAGVPLWLITIGLAAAATADLSKLSFLAGLKRCALLIASPLSAIRALDRTSERLLIDCHPLVAAHLLCDDGEFARILRREWFQREAEGVPQREKLRRFVREIGKEQMVSDTPVPEAGAKAFCPACWTQYQLVDLECAECGLEVRPFGRR